MNNLRVGEHQVCRADGIQELAQIKHQLMLLVLIQTLDPPGGLQQSGGGKQIALLESVEDGILLPVRCAEAFIAFLWLNNRVDLLITSPKLQSSPGHQLCILLNEIIVVVPGPDRVIESIEPYLLEGARNLGWINGQQFAVWIGLPELVNQGNPWIFLAFPYLSGRREHGWWHLHGTLNQFAPGFERILLARYCI